MTKLDKFFTYLNKPSSDLDDKQMEEIEAIYQSLKSKKKLKIIKMINSAKIENLPSFFDNNFFKKQKNTPNIYFNYNPTIAGIRESYKPPNEKNNNVFNSDRNRTIF